MKMTELSTVLVSIIIVNWNGKTHLENCLPALACQNCENKEIIIVDNGSNDGSAELISNQYPSIRLIRLDTNLGFDMGNIIGYRASKGKYIVLLNNDTRPKYNWLSELVKAALSDSRIGIVGSVMLRWDSNIVDTAGDGCTWAGVGYKMYSGDDYSNLPENIDPFGACAGAALYTREMIEEIGFLDEDFFMNLEDVDLSYRARLAGYRIVIAKLSIVEHRVSASVTKLSALNTYYASRNIELVWWKNTPNRYLWLSIPDKVLHYIVAFAMSIGNAERMKNFLNGKKDAYLLIMRGKVNRKGVQRNYNGQPIRLTFEIKRMLIKAGLKHV